VLVTLGAFGSLFSSINGNVNVGDGVIIIEPFFACYESLVRAAGGVARFIPLRLVKYDYLLIVMLLILLT
jgi:kynurenine--oxoglutarate transaminase/cysteine-S-conjugate beta-lyase/glutamine--phenylpyruvate transaminase